MADVTNYTIENASGANVRIDLNNVFAAIQSSNSKSTDLSASQCVAGMPFLNTTTKILKIRNSNNNGFTEIGNIDTANLGLLSKSGGTMTGPLLIDDSSSASTPALSFDTDTDLGLFRKAANIMGFSSAGTEQMVFDANGITLRQQNEIRFGDNDSSHYVALKSHATVGTNYTLTLPSGQGANGTILKNDGSGNLSFQPGTIVIGSTTINVGAGAASTISGLTSFGSTTLNSTEIKSNNYRDQNGNNSFTASQVASLFSSTGAGAVKAFVNFNGRGTVSIRGGKNVSSITDNGTGDYTVNFTSSLTDANYTPVTMCLSHDVQGTQIQTVVRGDSVTGPTTMNANACRIHRGNTSVNNYVDGQSIFFAAFR